MNTWQAIAQVYAQAFPNTLLTAVMQSGGFPPIDQNGQIFNGIKGMDEFAPTDIMAEGAADFGVQFTMQNDALSPSWIWTVVEEYAPQYITGYQPRRRSGSICP